MAGPLSGIRVIDLTSVLLGPYATQIMGDMGADVIKVEAPAGDITRHLAPCRAPGMGALFLNVNRNKRSLVLDLKRDAGRAALMRLAQGADVLIHSLRPQSARSLGLDYEVLRRANGRLIFCGTYGFGERGPYRGKPAYDDIIQAVCGLAALQSDDQGAPRYVNSSAADKIVGLTVAYAVSMALYHRERTGAGQAIEVPMFETMVSFLLPEHLAGATFDPPRGTPGYQRVLNPHRRPFATRDGFIGILPYTNEHWKRFFAVAGRTDLAGDPRFSSAGERSENIAQLYRLVADIMRERTTAQWLVEFEKQDIPAMPVKNLDDVLVDPHLAETAFFPLFDHPSEGRVRGVGIPVCFSETPGNFRLPAPRLGEHSIAVLREAGLAAEEIRRLLALGVTLDGSAQKAES